MMTEQCSIWDLSNTNRAPTVGREITSDGTTTSRRSALGAAIQNVVHTSQEAWTKTKGNIPGCPTTVEPTSEKQQSSGSKVFTWMYQQLSNTEWYGLRHVSNSSTNSATAGKRGTLDKGEEIKEDREARISHLATLMNASTSTAPMRQKAAEELQAMGVSVGRRIWIRDKGVLW